MLLERTKETTKSKHDLMEKLIGSHRLHNFSMEDFCLLASTNYIFHSNLEEQLIQNLSDSEKDKLNFSSRQKTESLGEDLKELGIPLHSLQLPTPNITNFYQALGWLYVAEGSMLGGKYIHKILAENKEIAKSTSFHFYKIYGSETGKLWKSFRKLVEIECQSDHEQMLFTNGAEQAYGYFEKAFLHSENMMKVGIS